MKKIFLYEPSIASNNLGDEIIVEGCKKALAGFLNNNYVVEIPTHTPLSNRYALFMGKPDIKIVCGSNILTGKLNQIRHVKQWALGYTTTWQLNQSIFIGVGAQRYQKVNYYTRNVYKRMFSSDYIHSVRDAYTEAFLKDMGINNVINTGCPTMWRLTREHCRQIPTTKADEVIFTLTDYSKDQKRDEFVLQVLLDNYKHVYFWPQGVNDFEYFKTIKNSPNVVLLPPNLKGYDDFLASHNVDFVGTRLHGGMRALQHKRRTLIIGIDNRAIELHKDINIPMLRQDEIENLPYLLESSNATEINLNIEGIAKFLSQFGIEYGE